MGLFSKPKKKSTMAKLPKIPKGLKAQIAKLERKDVRAKAIAQRKKEIASLKAKKATLQKKSRGY